MKTLSIMKNQLDVVATTWYGFFFVEQPSQLASSNPESVERIYCAEVSKEPIIYAFSLINWYESFLENENVVSASYD